MQKYQKIKIGIIGEYNLKTYKKTLLAVATGILIGGGTVYASSNIFAKLGEIRTNYDITLNFARTKKQEVSELQTQLDDATSDKESLNVEITQLKQDIEDLKTSHAGEITDKNAEIQQKQKEIEAKQTEVNAKQEKINTLNNQLSDLNGQLAQIEAEVDSLLHHTDAGVVELVGE